MPNEFYNTSQALIKTDPKDKRIRELERALSIAIDAIRVNIDAGHIMNMESPGLGDPQINYNTVIEQRILGLIREANANETNT